MSARSGVGRNRASKRRTSKAYISDLQEKLAASERRASLMVSQDPPLDQQANNKTLEIPGDATESYLSTQDRTVGNIFPITPSSSTVLASSLGVHVPTNEAPLTNPLAFHTIDWVPGPSGTPVFMGTSSNWAFNRRVLSMTHEAITGTALSPENLFFDGKVYDLRWDGGRISSSGDDFSLASLPTQDFAIYLINSVKFHCCRLFYLFEEDSFMEHFATFHASAADQSKVPRLWFVHYLIILAFGKAFIVQTSKSHQPPGADLFVQAMKLMPDFTFFECDYIERMQVLCCTSLYLHCISCRPAAYRYVGEPCLSLWPQLPINLFQVGQALSTAFEHGLHTEMQSHHLDETYVQRCRLVWWTIYVLERQMSALMGVPMFISDECVCTPFPIFYEQAQRTSALHIQIKLAQVLGQIHQTVYGIEGQLDSRYLGATKAVLQSIAGLATDLHAAVAMSMAAAIEPTLFPDKAAWSQRVFLILEEMSSHGNQALGLEFEQSLAMEAELSTDLLIDIANSLDPESLSWDFPVAEG
ncbi:uncharacterized protein CLUP02_04726 [Colletotrichum lupini]|uniref:Xylanolytic transcriptional activator regulatory domain-containing protein n=1 Tax=Colletotrichum lupini TaxID=145971 RepID=A0A9Q8SMM5_9PEZI|nr:uncharacterized protein CLUP02_04726 [Colletotrichum lupini]UQC79247.1 hypothetical protein CLUP02_04726 [Colletotrichum lupini]